MEGTRLRAARMQYQILHLAVYTEPGKQPSAHEQYNALGREFESKTSSAQEDFANEMFVCAALYRGYNTSRLAFIKKTNQIAQFRSKGFPGGDPQQIHELNDYLRLNEHFKIAVEPFKRGLDQIIRLHRTYPGSTFAYISITKLHERVSKEIAEIDVVDKQIRRWLAKLGGGRDRDPEAERKAKRKKLKEDIKGGRLDYKLPLLPLVSPEARWVFASSLGGGMGLASLWIQLDNDGVVQDRIVRKDTEFKEEDLNDQRLWIFNPKDPEHIIPMEYYCQTKLQEQPEAKSNIVLIRKFEADGEALVYRLYTIYCPFGDVHDLIDSNNMNRRQIPEAFVWMMFSVLTDCGLIMEQGGVDTAAADWKQIVHRDLKPMNIFLDLAAHDRFPRYPAPKMGDFGLAIETYAEDAGNPKRWRGLSGTEGYFTTEQLRLDRDPLPEPHWQLLAHTNVWGVGRIMWDAVNHSPSFQRAIQVAYRDDGTCDLEVREAVRPVYSDHLLSTIKDCMHFVPKSRPTFADLRRIIDTVMTTPRLGYDFYTYMNNARNGSQPMDDAHELHGLGGEKYKLDMAFQDSKA